MASTESVAGVVDRLILWLHRLAPRQSRFDDLTGALRAEFGSDTSPVTAEVCRAVERCAWRYSRHLALAYDPQSGAVPDETSPGWPDPDPEAIRARAGDVSRVERLPGGTAVIAVDGLAAAGVAGPYLDAAFTLAAGASRVVLDLRANGGGDPATVALIAGRLLGDGAQHLSDVEYRDRMRQWWTPELPAGTALRQDVAVLVGPGTFSSGEALAYHLQARGRVTVVGEATPGAADHITPITLTPSVRAFVPEATVVDRATGGNWEGTGVVPDVACPSADALTVAVERT